MNVKSVFSRTANRLRREREREEERKEKEREKKTVIVFFLYNDLTTI